MSRFAHFQLRPFVAHSDLLMNRCLMALLAALGLLSSTNLSLAANSNLIWKADLTVKEAYDGNVYLQDKEPTPPVPGTVPAKKDSWVTTITPRVGLDYKPCSGFNASLSYAPDIAVYHNAHSEDYFAHRFGLTLSGKADNVTWEQANALTYIDGNHLGPTFYRGTADAPAQDVPAIGGIPLRDRRDATVYRGGLKLTYLIGDFFVRPVGAAYVHDFRTLQQPSESPSRPGTYYENYLDRQDVNGGLDIGYDVGKKTFLVVGYRYGRQDQFRGPMYNAATVFGDSPYDSTYHRVLAGVEGTPASWLKLALLGGPDIRTWADDTPTGFDRDEMLYWIDASITLLPTKQDSIVLLNRRYEQPAFSSQSVYEDITYSVTWKHKFDDHWAGSAGFQLYIGDWQAPVNREDWIYTPSASLSYTHDKHLSAELAYSYDWVENQVPTTAVGAAYAEGREYTRHIVSLGLKYAF